MLWIKKISIMQKKLYVKRKRRKKERKQIRSKWKIVMKEENLEKD